MPVRNPSVSAEINAALADLLGVDRPAVYFDRVATDAGILPVLPIAQELAVDRVRPVRLDASWDIGTAAPFNDITFTFTKDTILTQAWAFVQTNTNLTDFAAWLQFPATLLQIRQMGGIALPAAGNRYVIGVWNPATNEENQCRVYASYEHTKLWPIFCPVGTVLTARLRLTNNPVNPCSLVFWGWEQKGVGREWPRIW